MKARHITPALLTFAFVMAGCAGEQAAEDASEGAGQSYPNLAAPLAFENDRVVVQTISVEPDVWAGEHGHEGNQLGISIDGGTQTYRVDGEETDVTYAVGEAFWVDAIESHDHMVKEAGLSAVLVTLKELKAGMGTGQTYPNIDPTVVFENDYVIVQKLTSEPGQWVGEHSHAGNQIAIVLKGGTTTYRVGDEETVVSHADGEVFWVEATDAHDHADDSATEALLVTLKG
ncbi:MAG: cupin domain-containing protein [Gemmatimonadetes bacterium]|nr:cupin domain-containing protein [Gemmatimonadota bacterium]